MSAYEQAVLGAMMLDASSYWRVADLIGAADFGDGRNAELFDVIAERCKKDRPVDAVTLGDEFPHYASYLYEIAGSSTVSSARAYAEEVRQHAENRRVKIAGQKIASSGCGYVEAQRYLAEVSPRNTLSAKPIKAYIGDALTLMQKRFDSQDIVTGLATGLDGLDEITAGLQPGSLVIVAARPSMGKTAFALQVGLRNALRDKRVIVFEMEMTGVQLSERSVSQISSVPFGSIKKPYLVHEEEWPRITKAYTMLEACSLIVDESSSQTTESICARARQQHMQSPLSLVVVDHLGLLTLPGKGNPVNELGDATKAFKVLAKDLGIPVIVLVQLNRSLEQRADKRPMLSDLRDSGRIEEDADLVLMLYRDEYYNHSSPHRGYAELLIRKNRDGETGIVPLRSMLHIMRFESCEGLPNATRTITSGAAIDFSNYTDRKTQAAGGD